MHIHFDCPACDMTDAPSDAYHHIGMNDLFTCRNCGARFHVVEAPATGTQIEISAARE